MIKAITRNKNLLLLLFLIIMFTITYFYFSNFSSIQILQKLQLKSYDILYQFRKETSPPQKFVNDIILVDIDDESFIKLERSWPWPREILAQFLTVTNKVKNRGVCFDLVLSGKGQDNSSDLSLSKEIKKTSHILLGSYFDKENKYRLPNPLFYTVATGVGFINRPRDVDLTIRRSRAFIKRSPTAILDYSFCVKAASLFWDIPFSTLKVKQQKNGYQLIAYNDDQNAFSIPLNKEGIYQPHLYAKADSFTIIPFWKILQEKTIFQKLKNKLIIVGTSSELFHDIHPTAIGLMPGMVLQANEILSILNNDFIQKIPMWLSLLLFIIIVVFTTVVSTKTSFLVRFFLCSCFATAIVYFNIKLLHNNFIWDFFGSLFLLVFTFTCVSVVQFVLLRIEASKLKTLAITDGLTGLYVYRYFELKLKNEFEKATLENKDIAIVFLDLDFFKKINDTYGHENANVILKNLALILKNLSRKNDTIVRYGGEEFAIMMPHTEKQEAFIVAERIRKSIEKHDFIVSQFTVNITVSIGISSMKEDKIETPSALVEAADRAVYKAKHSGRNKTCLYNPNIS